VSDEPARGGGAGPARPRTGLAGDRHGAAHPATYRRRGSRLTPAQARAWERQAGRWHLPDSVAETGFDPASWFGRAAPLVVEIGSGVGETVAAVAVQRPEADFLAFEVWRPGLAETFRRLERAGVENVRTCGIDAVWATHHLLPPGYVAEVWTFFPDPWPKTRHHKRRLVTPGFAALVASRLATGGVWRLATDWPDYAAQMRAVLDAEPALRGGPVPRWAPRPMTRFERRAAREGRESEDLAYRRL
jgi:tRNA (guanine-N7-)-methyltransferase